MSTWAINGSTPQSLGLRLVGGEFRSGSASTVRLESVLADFDAGTVFAYEQSVSITRDSVLLFQGTVRELPRSGSDASETQSFVIEDAWALLERTTYQELWTVNGGSVLLPQVVLGMDHLGNRIDVGAQIELVIAFAADTAGIDIQCGTMPAGLDLWPSEAVSQSCAEVIRTSLRYHPDWVCWIDHTTTPPTFHVTPRAVATVRALAVTDCAAVQIAEKADLIPECVRIVYTCANNIDDAVYRDYAVDKYPSGGDDSGPGTLTTVIELAGGQASIAKQQIETDDLPTFVGDAAANQTEGKAWLKRVYPFLVYVAPAGADPAKGIQDSSFAVTKYGKALIVDGNPKPTAINVNATRLDLRTVADAPRQLISGTIQEWMRKRSGKVAVQMLVVPTATATDDEIALLRTLPPWFEFIGTDAQTKIYKGQPQWRTIAESIPAGIAELYYETIANGCRWEGSVTLTDKSTIGAIGWMGGVLDLTGSADTNWAAMKAPIHSITWDAKTEKCTLSFGPNPNYSVQDFCEYLRLLRRRAVTWWTQAERTSSELGCQTEPSAKGDHIGGLVLPKKNPQPPPPPRPAPFLVETLNTGSIETPVYQAVVNHGRVLERQRATASTNMLYWEPDNMVTAAVGSAPAFYTRFTATVGNAIYVKVTESIPGTSVTACTIITGASTLQSVETSGSNVVFNYKLAEFVTLPDGTTGVKPFLMGANIYHWPEGKGLNLKVQTWTHDASGNLTYKGSGYDVTHYWRKGAYVGKADPGTSADETQIIAKVET